MKTHHILNLGAGVQSTALALMSHRGGFEGVPKFDCAIFADTGDEPSDVYRHLEWLIREVQDSFPVIVRRKERSLSENLVKGVNSWSNRFVSIPCFTAKVRTETVTIGDQEKTVEFTEPGGMTRRQCTKEFKIDVVEASIRRDVLGLQPRERWPSDEEVHQYFGLSFDEGRRVVRVRARMIADGRSVPHFPLFDMQFTRADCLAWLRRYGMPHETPRSACVFCPYKSDQEWLRLKTGDPEGWAKAVQIDRAIRTADAACARGLNEKLFLHRSCAPLETVELEKPQSATQQYFTGFAQECEGMCGL